MRVWSALPARPATARRKPGFAELLHFISPLRVRPAACAGLSGRSRRPPPHRGSHGVLGSAGGTDGFYFQPPFLAGLSGYIAELGAAFVSATIGIKLHDREDPASSEERRVRKECVSTCKSRRSTHN